GFSHYLFQNFWYGPNKAFPLSIGSSMNYLQEGFRLISSQPRPHSPNPEKQVYLLSSPMPLESS
ncbi:MAG TPA: hypothetical protein VGZ71_14320, partial [Puia sp.]|nr:hypothetical protein [Puia sp.]